MIIFIGADSVLKYITQSFLNMLYRSAAAERRTSPNYDKSTKFGINIDQTITFYLREGFWQKSIFIRGGPYNKFGDTFKLNHKMWSKTKFLSPPPQITKLCGKYYISRNYKTKYIFYKGGFHCFRKGGASGGWGFTYCG